MKSFVTFVIRLIAFVKFVVSVIKSEQWEKHYMASMLVALVLVGSILIEVGKKHDIELERQHQAELEQMRHDIYVNNEVTRH
jgi:hypothetical protein